MKRSRQYGVKEITEERNSERKLRAVVDTNLFISGIFAKGSLSAELQDLWIKQEFKLATSIEILKEVSRVLHYPRIKEDFKPKDMAP